MIIALFPNEKKEHSFSLASDIAAFLQQKGVTVVAEDQKAQQIGAKPISSVNPKDIQFLISMGGDGTILRLTHQWNHLNAVIVGINLGHLGFMADIPLSDIYPSLTNLIEGNYTVEERMVIETGDLYAVNDIVLHRGSNQSLIKLAIYVDSVYVNTFIADGIIIATPNGSTAYSLAAGGPILTPTLDAIVITPICPHTISNRPLVLDGSRTIEIHYLSDYDPIDVRADGLDSIPLSKDGKLVVKKSKRTFKRALLEKHEYFSTLRTKLGWAGSLHSRP